MTGVSGKRTAHNICVARNLVALLKADCLVSRQEVVKAKDTPDSRSVVIETFLFRLEGLRTRGQHCRRGVVVIGRVVIPNKSVTEPISTVSTVDEVRCALIVVAVELIRTVLAKDDVVAATAVIDVGTVAGHDHVVILTAVNVILAV